MAYRGFGKITRLCCLEQCCEDQQREFVMHLSIQSGTIKDFFNIVILAQMNKSKDDSMSTDHSKRVLERLRKNLFNYQKTISSLKVTSIAKY